MQKIIIEKPYRFIPPHRGEWWSWIIQHLGLFAIWLRRSEGVVEYECRSVDLLRASLAAGHGILLTPNHCRNADPIVMGWLAREAGCHVYAMASWHLFNQSRFTAWAIHKMGGFSVNREGVDLPAINAAIGILEEARRPLIVFPEGAVTRTNDRLHAMLDGVAFIARAGAKKRARRIPDGKVVVHPVALKYLFGGNLEATTDPVLTEIERRLSWRAQRDRPLTERVARVGHALLALKEIEYFGEVQHGQLGDRLRQLINRLLQPLEEEWLGGRQEGSVVPRVKALRVKMLPEMVSGSLTEVERRRRWNQLADIYLAQQVSCYPPDYLQSPVSADRLLETVERLEEDLTDQVRVHGSLKVVIQVGEPIEVGLRRDRKAPSDPLMERIERDLQAMLDKLASESRLLVPSAF